MPRLLLLLFLTTLLACPGSGRRDDDDTTEDDDDTTDDDDDSGDDDDSTGDDDDSTAGDDDDSTNPNSNAPTIVDIDVCETQLIGNAYVQFDIEVSDPNGDLLDPVRYFMTWRNIDNGDSGPLQQFQVEEDMGNGGTIRHLQRIGLDGISRNRQYEFDFYILDAVANQSNTVLVPYFIYPEEGQDPC